MLTKKQQRILKLAEAGGTDKELAILDAINEMEDDFQKQVDDLKKTINSRLLDALLVKSANHPDYEKIVSRIKGDKGDKGDSIYGPMGPQGPQGEKGDKGDKGDVGPQGESIVGPKGDKGEKGEKGIDGSPDTAEQVRDKLETLQGDNRLDKSAVKGLDEELKKINREKRTPIFGPGKTRIITLDLSSQLNGVTKTFTWNTHYGIVGVYGSSAPFVFRPLIDYTENPYGITFTANVDETVSLVAGQTVVVQYLK